MRLSSRCLFVLVGGGLFGAFAVRAVGIAATMSADNDVPAPTGSGFLAGIGLAMLVIGVIAKR